MIIMFFDIFILTGIRVEGTIGILAAYTIPAFTFLISEGDYNVKLTVRKLGAYIPLFVGFNILVFEAIAFLGFSDYRLIQLGYEIAQSRPFLFVAPWASIWPGLAIFVIVFGFFSLHYGMKEPIPIAGRL